MLDIVSPTEQLHQSNETTEELLEKLIQLHYFELQEFTISPNDEEILCVFGNTDMPVGQHYYGERNRSIWKLHVQSGKIVQLTESDEDANTPSWSPDGKKIAYFARSSGKKELWVMNFDGNKKRQLTSSTFSGKDPFVDSTICWSPDSTKIAYNAHPNGSFYGAWQSIENEQKHSSSIQVESAVNNQLQSILDQANSLFRDNLYIYHIESNENQIVINQCPQSITIHNWSKQENQLLFNKGTALIRMDMDTFTTDVQYNHHLDFIKLINDTIFASYFDNSQLVIGYIQSNGFIQKTIVNLTDYELITIQNCSNDGNYLYFTAQLGVSNKLYQISIETGEITALTEDGKTVECFFTCPAKIQAFHNKDSIVFPYSNPCAPTELYEINKRYEINNISHFSKEYVPEHLPNVQVIHYPSAGHNIESLLVLPNDYNETKTYPTLIYLHGGPEDFITANFAECISGRAQSAAHYLATHGYVILMPNFRGSGGYSESFTYELSSYNLVQAPYEDVIAGVDFLVREGITDSKKIGIYGSSYGAQLTAWTISQTDRFKGAIGMVGDYDLLHEARYRNNSLHSAAENRSQGTISDDLWTQPELYKKISPMEHYDKINTPLLFIETSKERALYGSQSKPLYHALLARNIPTNLIYYPDASHNGGWNDRYKRDYMKRIVAWFDYCIQDVDLPQWFQKNE